MNAFNHLKTVLTHKKYVFLYCFIAGITWQGIKHDMSKLNPKEFFESVKYYQGNRSPIDASREENGYSKAFLHHVGHNKHHYEYWIDHYDMGGIPVQMPYKYALELVCDYLGAGRAYMKDKFTYQAEYQWWMKKNENPIMMHPHTKAFVDEMLWRLSEGQDEEIVLRHSSKGIYAELSCQLDLRNRTDIH